MKKITTKDNSITFHNKKYNETYHSVSGAKQEAQKKFVEPCKINEIAKKGSITILDICFGLGYNSAAAIDAALKANPDCKIKIIALENDKAILNEIKRLETTFNCYEIIKKIAEKHRAERGNIEIDLLLGDAREKIKEIKNIEFDAVFLDPFSPKKCPELWTEDFFKQIHKLMKKDSILTTYSCAKTVRDNLKKAGFEVKDGPVVGRKAPGSIATK